MRLFTDQSPLDGCPASPVILAVRAAQTPLAIANVQATDATILFANEAFATLVGEAARALVGRPLAALARPALARVTVGSTDRFELSMPDGSRAAVALSTAVVTGPEGSPFCLLCSLVETSPHGAESGPAADVELLAQVARAASQLMLESTVALGVDAGMRVRP